MARGKYKNAAQAREARESAIAEAARLRKENDALCREMTELRQRMDERHARDVASVRDMREALATGAEPKIGELKREIEGFEAEIQALRSTLNLEEWLRKAVVNELVAHYIDEHGMTPTQAVQMLSDAAVMDRPAIEVLPDGVNPKHAAKLSPEARQNFKRAKIRQLEEPAFMIRGEIE